MYLAICSVAAKLKLEQHIEGLREGSKGTRQITIIVIRKLLWSYFVRII